MNLEQQIEAILFYRNEPVSPGELSKILKAGKGDVTAALDSLAASYRGRGIVLVRTDDEASFGTHPDLASLIEDIRKEELSRELSRAAVETLAIVLYRGPVSRRDVDHIRGVNSAVTLRNLLIRGLVERSENEGDRRLIYKPTLKLLEYLGITKQEELPEYESSLAKIETFMKNADEAETSQEDAA